VTGIISSSVYDVGLVLPHLQKLSRKVNLVASEGGHFAFLDLASVDGEIANRDTSEIQEELL
jgi:hypothetical protein